MLPTSASSSTPPHVAPYQVPMTPPGGSKESEQPLPEIPRRELPAEVFSQIFSHLESPQDRLSCLHVCQWWKAIMASDLRSALGQTWDGLKQNRSEGSIDWQKHTVMVERSLEGQSPSHLDLFKALNANIKQEHGVKAKGPLFSKAQRDLAEAKVMRNNLCATWLRIHHQIYKVDHPQFAPEATQLLKLSEISPQTAKHIKASLTLLQLLFPGMPRSGKEISDSFQGTLNLPILSLDLQNVLQLRIVPSEIFGRLSGLESLNLSNNQLISLPDAIGCLALLQWLILENNQITALPDTIGRLSELRRLDLAHNKLSVLPDTIGHLIKLEHLILRDNQLTTLPDSIGDLTELQSLSLFNNELSILPNTIGKLKLLQLLFLSNNKLTDLPDAIGKLIKLRDLQLGGNQLTALPDTIGNLEQLNSLVLSNNQITALPDTIGSLRQLGLFHVLNNQLSALPHAICALTKLQVLDFSNNKLTALPDDIGKLVLLQILHFSNNKLNALPDTICALTNLWELVCENNPLITFPFNIVETFKDEPRTSMSIISDESASGVFMRVQTGRFAHPLLPPQ